MATGKTAAELLVERLVDWGVDTVFGLPGDGINGIMEALRKARDQVRFVHVRHEEAAALAACGYAKFTGRLGVCLATSGPGAIHLLNGLYDAKFDGAPVLAITGMAYHDLIGTFYQQDVANDRLFQDVARFNERIMSPTHIVNVVDLAARTALSHRAVAHIAFPNDLQDEAVEEAQPSQKNVPGHTSNRFQMPVRVPLRADLERAAAVFAGKRKPVILAGSGARGAAAELEEAAERLGAPIVKPLLGKDVVPDDSPYTSGGAGMLGTRPSQEALAACDALLLVGTSFPYIEYLPQPGQAVAVQIDIEPARLGLRYPIEVGLAGDAVATLRELLPLLPHNDDRGFLTEIQGLTRQWWATMAEHGTRSDTPMKPQVVTWNLNDLLADNAIIAADSGTNTFWASRQIRLRRGQRFSVSGTLATMACAVPYAIGAQLAYPDRQVVAVTGDGGFAMLMAEFATCVHERLPIKVVVLKNNVLGMIKWEQMLMLGNPQYGVELPDIDFVKVAEACGGRGLRIDDPARCREQLQAALAMDGPVLVEAVIDPHEPIMPPKLKPEQAEKLAQALRSGQPNAQRIGLTLFRNVVDEEFFTDSSQEAVDQLQEEMAEVASTDKGD